MVQIFSRIAIVVCTLVISLSWCPPSEASGSTKVLDLDGNFEPKEPGTTFTSKSPINVRAVGVDGKITYAEIEVVANNLTPIVRGASVKDGLWSVTIGPFLPKSSVKLTIRAIQPITDLDKLRTKIQADLKTVFEASILRKDTAWTPDEYAGLVASSVTEAVKKAAGDQVLRGSDGKPIDEVLSDLVKRDGVKIRLDAYITYINAVTDMDPVNLAGSFDFLQDLKAFTAKPEFSSWDQEPVDASVVAFWAAVKACSPPTETDAQIKSLRSVCAAFEAADEPLSAQGVDAFCQSCSTYGKPVKDACAELHQAERVLSGDAEKDADTLLTLLMNSIGGALSDLAVISTVSGDIPIADIEYWAGFDVGFLNLEESKQLGSFFLIDIHPARIEMGGPGIATKSFWGNGQWWKHLSLSVGLSFSSIDHGGESETGYFAGVGFRLNPYFRIHAGQNFIFSSDQNNVNTRTNEWAYGVSINVREIAHVLGLFSGVPESFQ